MNYFMKDAAYEDGRRRTLAGSSGWWTVDSGMRPSHRRTDAPTHRFHNVRQFLVRQSWIQR
jgi:hypothetical protein